MSAAVTGPHHGLFRDRSITAWRWTTIGRLTGSNWTLVVTSQRSISVIRWMGRGRLSLLARFCFAHLPTCIRRAYQFSVTFPFIKFIRLTITQVGIGTYSRHCTACEICTIPNETTPWYSFVNANFWYFCITLNFDVYLFCIHWYSVSP